MKNTFKQVLQVILRIYVIKFTAFYQREDECRVSCCILTADVHTVLEQQLYRFHPLLTEVVRYFRCTVLEDIFQGFPLVYRIVHSLSHQFVCHEFGILHHHDHLMMDTFKDRSCKLPSFPLYLLTAELHGAEQVFIHEHIADGVYYLHRCSVRRQGINPQPSAVRPASYMKHLSSFARPRWQQSNSYALSSNTGFLNFPYFDYYKD